MQTSAITHGTGPGPLAQSSDALMTAREVAALLRVTPGWIYAATRRNAIPHVPARTLRALPPFRNRGLDGNDRAGLVGRGAMMLDMSKRSYGTGSLFVRTDAGGASPGTGSGARATRSSSASSAPSVAPG
jgi:hypothetical protein